MYSLKSQIEDIVKQGTCTGCGLCVGLDYSNKSIMKDTKNGSIPFIHSDAKIARNVVDACPGYRLNYPNLYIKHYGAYPKNWLTGNIKNVYVGYSNDNYIRNNGASGGVITTVLCFLIDSKKIDAAIVVKQGIPIPELARSIIAYSREEIISASQSVYIPVSVLDILNKVKLDEEYAITCLPDQAAALRKMQTLGDKRALRIKYILGPYTGTAIKPEAIKYFIRSKGVKKNDSIVSLKWRAGEWPGYLEIKTEKGKVLQSKKVYYNFLIPFFVTHTSLQNMDFANEFADLAVGDAWSPEYENQGKGFSVVVSRSESMDDIINSMERMGLINLSKKEEEFASQMHGHMIDFKKRGSYIRNRFRALFGLKYPDFGYKPDSISMTRIMVELFISSLFFIGRTRFARLFILIIPEKIMGFLFNKLRLRWKAISKPVKRKSLGNYNVIIGKK